MDCRITDGKPNPNQIELARNSGHIEKRTIVWNCLEGTYVIKVPPDVFVGRKKPEDCLILIDPDRDGTVLLKTSAKKKSYTYEIVPPGEQAGSDTPPEIIVNDEGPVDKQKKKAGDKKRAKKAAMKKAPVGKTK